MRWQIRKETAYDWSGRIAVAAVLALAMLVAGCGKDDIEVSDRGTDPRVRSTVSTTPTPPVTVSPATYTEAVTPEPVITGPVSYERAETAFREKRYGDATLLFSRYLDDKPENPWGYYMLGLSAWKAGGLDSAEGAFRKALELDPMHRKSVHNLSRVLLDDGRPAEAEELLRTLLESDSTVGETWRLIGRACQEQGDLVRAIDAYRQALILDEQDVWAANNLGLVHLREGRFEEALPPLAHAVTVKPGVAVFQNNLGMALERTGHLPLAVEAYRKAVEADPGYSKAKVNLGRVEPLAGEDPVPVDLALLAEGFLVELRLAN